MGKKEYNMKKIFKWGSLVIALASFALLIYVVQGDKVTKFDLAISSSVAKIQSNGMTKIVKVITEFGNFFVLGTMAIIVTLLVKTYKEKILLWINIGLVAAINYGLKQIFQRQRPTVHLIKETGYSFPSGHSAVSMAVYLYLIYIVVTKVSKKWLKILLALVMSAIIILVGFSRIYLGAHFASDVLAGFCVGIIYNVLFIHFCHSTKIAKK